MLSARREKDSRAEELSGERKNGKCGETSFSISLSKTSEIDVY